MKKIIILVVLICLTLLTSCSTSNISFSESQVESETFGLSFESSVDNEFAESNQLFAPYKSYLRDSNIEDVLNDNPIDKSFLAEELNLVTTVETTDFIGKYSQIWDNELKFTLKNLQVKLEGSALITLNDSQSAWQKFYESNYNLGGEIHLVTAGVGSGIGILNGYKSIALIRERTLELKEYYYMATGDFTFNFR